MGTWATTRSAPCSTSSVGATAWACWRQQFSLPGVKTIIIIIIIISGRPLSHLSGRPLSLHHSQRAPACYYSIDSNLGSKKSALHSTSYAMPGWPPIPAHLAKHLAGFTELSPESSEHRYELALASAERSYEVSRSMSRACHKLDTARLRRLRKWERTCMRREEVISRAVLQYPVLRRARSPPLSRLPSYLSPSSTSSSSSRSPSSKSDCTIPSPITISEADSLCMSDLTYHRHRSLDSSAWSTATSRSRSRSRARLSTTPLV